jgi:hypothetical protein
MVIILLSAVLEVVQDEFYGQNECFAFWILKVINEKVYGSYSYIICKHYEWNYYGLLCMLLVHFLLSSIVFIHLYITQISLQHLNISTIVYLRHILYYFLINLFHHSLYRPTNNSTFNCRRYIPIK